MSAWVVIPCLLTLRDEFNRVSPKRDKGADGTIGDTNHKSSSDHTPDEDSSVLRGKDSDRKNEVHGLDIDSTGPWPDGKGGQAGGWFDRKIKQLIAEEKRRWLDPNDVCRLEYIIWRGQIYSRIRDFAPIKYSGADGHYGHAHFSARYLTKAENDTRPWGVYVAPKPIQKGLPVDQEQFNKLMDNWAKTQNAQDIILGWEVTDYADQPTQGKEKRKLTLRQWFGYSEGRGQINTLISMVRDLTTRITGSNKNG